MVLLEVVGQPDLRLSLASRDRTALDISVTVLGLAGFLGISHRLITRAGRSLGWLSTCVRGFPNFLLL